MYVGGNLYVQGNTTYIDSTNVTVYDHQIELASLSGNDIYRLTDAEVNDAGIVVKSSGDGTAEIDGDKSWLWKENCNAWTAKGSLDQYNLVDVSGIIFNGDCNHIISGAYKAGSGLSLHNGLEFNVGDVFKVGVSPSVVDDVHLGHSVLVSGVSGVNTVLQSTSNQQVIYIDPTELSGILAAGTTTASYGHWKASGDSAGVLKQVLTTEQVYFSGADNVTTTLLNNPLDGGYVVEIAASGGRTPGSGLILHPDDTINLNVPSGSYAHMTAGQAEDKDQVLVWDSGSHIFTYMSLGELESKVGGGSSSSDSFTNVYTVDPGSTAFVSTTDPVVAGSTTDNLYLVAGDHIELKSDIDDNAVQITNIGTPIVSGMVDVVSGVAIFNSGELVLTSGILQGTIDNLSGITHEYTAGSGFIRYADGSTPSIYSFNLNDPDVSYDAIAAGASDLGDQMLLWHDDTDAEHGWNHITLTELKAKIDEVGAGGDSAFKIITVDDADAGDWSATEDVTADTTTDTLKLVAGTGIQLNSRDSDDAIRIYSVGSHTVSGMFVSGSGALHQEILESGAFLNSKIGSSISPTGMQSGISVFNSTYNIVDTYANGSGMFWDSGNMSLSLGGVSDTVSSLFIDTITSDRGGILLKTSDSQSASLLEVRGPDGTLSGIYIDKNADLVARNSNYHGQAEFFAGRQAAKDASNAGQLVAIGQCAGELSDKLSDGVVIGSDAGHLASGDSIHSIFVGTKAGWKSFGKPAGDVATVSALGVGYNALYSASGITNVTALGSWAGRASNVCMEAVFVGNRAGLEASGCHNSIFIGDHAGNKASGHMSDGLESNQIAIGTYAGATGQFNNQAVMMGYEAGALATGCAKTNMIGQQAGYDADNCDYTNMIGHQAGYQATGCDNTNMIGKKAGYQATGCDNTNMIGHNAGYDADNCDYTNMIGFLAGFEATGCDTTNMIGYYAGYEATGCDYTAMIGRSAGASALSTSYANMIGHFAGSYVQNCGYSSMIGYEAGYFAKNSQSTVMIGDFAGHYADDCMVGVFIGNYAGGKTSSYKCMGDYNVYIGANSGKGHWGSGNISIIANGDDEFNLEGLETTGADPQNHGQMNLGNVIFAKTNGDNLGDYVTGQSITSRRVAIGYNPVNDDGQIGATLVVKPANEADVTTTWLKRSTSQSEAILRNDTSMDLSTLVHYTQTSLCVESSFPSINSNGLLTLPIFTSLGSLNTSFPAADNDGAMVVLAQGSSFKLKISINGLWKSIGIT